MPQKNKRKLLDEHFSSLKESRKEILDLLITRIDDSGVSICLSYEELFLALDEAVTNAMEHGNKWDSAKKVRIIIELDSEHLYIRIMDEGAGFNFAEIINRIKNRDKLSIRGRGIFIMNQFCGIDWNQRGKELILTVKLSA